MDITLKDNIGEYNNIQVEAYYTKGGMNYFRGGINKRGIYFRAKGNTVEKNERGIIISRSFLLFGTDDYDFSYLVVTLKRANKKRLADINAAIETMDKDKIVELYTAKDKRGLVDLMIKALTDTGTMKIAA